MYRNVAGFEKSISYVDAVAPAMESGAAAVGYGLVFLDTQREIRFEEFVGHVGERWPQRMAVGAVAERTPRNTAEANLIQLIPFAAPVVARIHEMRRRRESRRAEKFRLALSEQAAEHIEDAP